MTEEHSQQNTEFLFKSFRLTEIHTKRDKVKLEFFVCRLESTMTSPLHVCVSKKIATSVGDKYKKQNFFIFEVIVSLTNDLC